MLNLGNIVTALDKSTTMVEKIRHKNLKVVNLDIEDNNNKWPFNITNPKYLFFIRYFFIQRILFYNKYNFFTSNKYFLFYWIY